MRSKLGCLFAGPVNNQRTEPDESEYVSNLIIQGTSPLDEERNSETELVHSLRKFWEVEQYGVEDAHVNAMIKLMLFLQVKIDKFKRMN